MRIKAFLATIALSLSLAACGDAPVTEAKVTPTVEISGLYVMKPSAGRDVAGGGMKVTATNGDFRLTGISTDAADRVELHTMIMEDDMMRMRQVDGYDIAAGETQELAPGGPHMMLFGFDTTLAEGDSAEMLLTFEGPDGDEVTLNYTAEVTGIGGPAHGEH